MVSLIFLINVYNFQFNIMSKCQNLTINFFFYWVILQQHFYASSVNKFIYGYLDLKITYPIPLLELLISLYSLFIHGLLLGQNSVYLAIWWLWSYKKMTHFLCTYLQILWKLISHECVKCKHLSMIGLFTYCTHLKIWYTARFVPEIFLHFIFTVYIFP